MFLTLTLFKYLLRCIKQLEEPQTYFAGALEELGCYYQSKEYRSLQGEITNYAGRYEKEYLDVLKSTDIGVIRAVNRRFPELSFTTIFGH